MDKAAIYIASFLCMLLCTQGILAQYPTITSDVKSNTDRFMDQVKQRSDHAWSKALAIRNREAAIGKRYIHGASRPEDLPKAEIQAFPGAAGGGMYSFRGRGGRVFVVDN